MNLASAIVLAVVAALFALAVWKAMKKGGCNCGCKDCGCGCGEACKSKQK